MALYSLKYKCGSRWLEKVHEQIRTCQLVMRAVLNRVKKRQNMYPDCSLRTTTDPDGYKKGRKESSLAKKL
jgi:hypothetical protein